MNSTSDFYNPVRPPVNEGERNFRKMNENFDKELSGSITPDVFVTDSAKNRFKLSELAQEKTVLIYRFSELNCNTCYETELSSLHNSSYPLVILGSYQAYRDFTVFVKRKKVELPIYWMEQTAFDWKAEGYNSPYYFILHSDMKATHFYIPNKMYPESDKRYFEEAKKLLEKK
ncbi:hypothetical protein FACS1894123_00240 [Bacteroidia bacterium]|nr:hypothetical protein FACS1894123_00240 [Bacteroidia bacterium]